MQTALTDQTKAELETAKMDELLLQRRVDALLDGSPDDDSSQGSNSSQGGGGSQGQEGAPQREHHDEEDQDEEEQDEEGDNEYDKQYNTEQQVYFEDLKKKSRIVVSVRPKDPKDKLRKATIADINDDGEIFVQYDGVQTVYNKPICLDQVWSRLDEEDNVIEEPFDNAGDDDNNYSQQSQESSATAKSHRTAYTKDPYLYSTCEVCGVEEGEEEVELCKCPDCGRAYHEGCVSGTCEGDESSFACPNCNPPEEQADAKESSGTKRKATAQLGPRTPKRPRRRTRNSYRPLRADEFIDDGDAARNADILKMTKSISATHVAWSILYNETIEMGKGRSRTASKNPQEHFEVSSGDRKYLIRKDLYEQVNAGDGNEDTTISNLINRPPTSSPPCRLGIDYFNGEDDGNGCLKRYLEAIGWEPTDQTLGQR